MAQPIEESLLQAIKKDDVKQFNCLMENAQCGAYRLGRFPVLSLLYLYKSRAILSAYEQSFLKITSYKELREPVEVSKKFSAKAGKCLRLYLNETVSPAEMLLILDKAGRLKRIYPLTKASEAAKGRLKAIYSIKYSLNVNFEGDAIIIDRRPLSYREKKKIATVCLCGVLAVTLAVGVPIAAVTLMPKPIEGEVIKIEDIDFSSQKEYTLKNDVVMPANYSVEKVNCTIYGGGNKLILKDGARLGELNGSISDMIIESSGRTVFTTVTENAVIENVTVNVNAAVTVAESSAFVASTNYGTIDGVTLNVKGKINARAGSSSAELDFGGIAQSNSFKYDYSAQKYYIGTIKNCTVNYSQVSLVGEAGANAAFGGVAAVNSGYLQDCTVTGGISGDTFDIAGVCVVNDGVLSDNVNRADLFQISSDSGWNPITCGIVLSNEYTAENCRNFGKINSVSDCGRIEEQEGGEPAASAAGIAYLNRGSSSTALINCINYGDVECSAEFRNVYSAGVCVSTSGVIESCKNSGNISADSGNDSEAYASGISAIAYGYIYECVNEGAINAAGGDVYAGGIMSVSALTYDYFAVYCGIAEYCVSGGEIKINAYGAVYAGGVASWIVEMGFNNSDGSVQYFGGCIQSCYFTGTITADCSSDENYAGNIVGVCGEHIYESNSYISNNVEYHNFDNNYYSDKSLTAFGATVSADRSFTVAEGKGSTQSEKEDIINSETYRLILSAFENK